MVSPHTPIFGWDAPTSVSKAFKLLTWPAVPFDRRVKQGWRGAAILLALHP